MANLLDTLTEKKTISSLSYAIEATKLHDFLTSPGPFTLLAPTDDAFGNLPEGELEALLADPATLKRILMYHVLSGDVRSDDLAEIDEAPTEEGSIVAVSRTNGRVQINEAQVLQTDILTDNGVIHVIDQVLIPGVLEDTL